MANLLINNEFDVDTVGWDVLLTDTGDATISSSTVSPYNGEASCKITVVAGGAAYSSVKVRQQSFSIVNGVKYRVRVALKADSARSVFLYLTKNVAPFNNYGLFSSCSVTTSWKIFEVNFTANTTASDAGLFLFCGVSAINVFADQIMFEPLLSGNSFVGNPVYLDTFSSDIDIANSLCGASNRLLQIRVIKLFSPTAGDYVIFTDNVGVVVQELKCSTTNQDVVVMFRQPYFSTGLKLLAANASVTQGAHILIYLV